MTRGSTRWGCLAAFAVVNLVFWVAVAAVAALTVSDNVDLGVETFLRERQATAETVLQQAPTQVSAVKTWTVKQISSPQPTAPVPIEAQPTTAPSAIPPISSPTHQPTPAIPAGQGTEAVPTPRPAPTSGAATPTPTATPAHSPLLMSDPELDALADVKAEMGSSAVGRPAQIRFQEAALNRAIADFVQQHPELPYDNLHVDLKRNWFTLTGNVTINEVPMNAEVVGTLVVEDCQPRVDVGSISTAGVQAPGLFRDAIMILIAESVHWFPQDHPLCLEQIVLEEERMTLYGSRR